MKKKALAILICAALLFVMAMSFSFIIVHARHDCSGGHCAVCVQINACGSFLNQAGIIVFFITAAGFAAPLLKGAAEGPRFYPRGSTLVSLRTKLSD